MLSPQAIPVCAFDFHNTENCLLFLLNFSIFWMTNETINIWSHIFGWMLFLALTLYDLFLLNFEASVFDKFIVGLLLGCFQVSY
jgi:hypothetical protein